MPTTKPGLPAKNVVLTGTPEAGVEAGCLLLDGYLLVGGPRELLAGGQQLTITGTQDPTLMGICQQGTPLKVDSAQLAGRTST